MSGIGEWRSCGECQECCVAFEIDEYKKPINARCQHQCAAGCGIWGRPERPRECTGYACLWVPVVSGLPPWMRPDKSGLIIDNVPSAALYHPNPDLVRRAVRVTEVRPGAAALPGNAAVLKGLAADPTLLVTFCRSWGTHQMKPWWLLTPQGRRLLLDVESADGRSFYMLPEHESSFREIDSHPDAEIGRAIRDEFERRIAGKTENEQRTLRTWWNAMFTGTSGLEAPEERIAKLKEMFENAAEVERRSGGRA